MTPETIALAQVASYIFAVMCWLVIALPSMIPEGWEDAEGFHYGRPGDAQS